MAQTLWGSNCGRSNKRRLLCRHVGECKRWIEVKAWGSGNEDGEDENEHTSRENYSEIGALFQVRCRENKTFYMRWHWEKVEEVPQSSSYSHRQVIDSAIWSGRGVTNYITSNFWNHCNFCHQLLTTRHLKWIPHPYLYLWLPQITHKYSMSWDSTHLTLKTLLKLHLAFQKRT